MLPFGNYLLVTRMVLKMLIVRDNEVLMEIPLSVETWPQDFLQRELESFEREFNRFTKLFDALSHETRLRMIKRLFEEDDHTLGFTDFTKDLGLNPKIVWQNTKKLRDGGLLKKNEKGRYTFSRTGRAEVLILSLALRHLEDFFEGI